MNDFFNAAVWEQAWNDHGEAVLQKMKKDGISPANAFDLKAKTFNGQSFSEEGKKRSARILNWIEGQGVQFDDASVLDVGAASGVFTVPLAERGARVTAVESSQPLVELLEENTAKFRENKVQIVPEPFENIDVPARGWSHSFDLVFVSMCPVIYDWEGVEKLLQCAKQFCYISMPVAHAEHSLFNEVLPLLGAKPIQPRPLEMGYLLHLLYLKGYAYESLVTREDKTTELSHEEALQELKSFLPRYGLSPDDRNLKLLADYLKQAYPSGKVTVRQGGRFGKVLIRLQEQSMYSKDL